MIKHMQLFVYGILTTIGGFILFYSANRIEETTLHTYVDQTLLEGMMYFLGIFVTGLGVFMLLLSFVITPKNQNG